MKRFDGVLIKEGEVILYKVVAVMPIVRSEVKSPPRVVKINHQPKWRGGSYLTTEAFLREKFDRENGIA